MHRPTIHRSTAVVALGLFGILILVNVPGELISLGGFGSSDMRSVHSGASYEHGWPWMYLDRSFEYPYPGGGTGIFSSAPNYGVPWLAWASWEFWRGDNWRVRVGALILNLVVGSLLILAIAGGWEWRRRRRTRLFQFTLAECLVAFVVVAAPLGWWLQAKSATAREVAAIDSLGESAECAEDYHGPLWLRRLVGVHLAWNSFSRVDFVQLVHIDGEVFEQLLPLLRAFPYLRELDVEGDPDSSMPVAFSTLNELKGVRSLSLDKFKLTQRDLDELAKVHQLKELAIMNMDEQDPAIIQKLKDAMPDCFVTDDALAIGSDEQEQPPY
jgi:hypothetical protein